MASQIRQFHGFTSTRAPSSFHGNTFAANPCAAPRTGRTRLTVQSFKKTFKKKQVAIRVSLGAGSDGVLQLILLEDVEKLGKKGELVTVAMGYWRNYLSPFRKAKAATAETLASPSLSPFRHNSVSLAPSGQKKRQQSESEPRFTARNLIFDLTLLQIKEKATRLAVALKTIGKFVVKKKSGEGGSIFGSVTRQEVADAVYQQTGQELDKREITLPEIAELGSYEATVKLHPEVVGRFQVVVAQEKNAPGRK